MATDGALLTAEEVSVHYGEVPALSGFDVSTHPGRLTGLIGPDGAGKTTAIRTLVGLQAPRGGRITLGGEPLGKSRDMLASMIGYMPQRFSLYVDLTIDENIAFFARLHGVRRRRRNLDGMLRSMGLDEFRGRLAGKLSGGMKQKLALLCVLVHEPSLIIMDEPTTGVDPVSRREFWKILGELAARGMSILVATPYLDEAERCHEVLLMHEGHTILRGDPHHLVQGMERPVFEIPVEDPFILRQKLGGQEWVRTAQAFGNHIHLTCNDPTAELDMVTRHLRAMGEESSVQPVHPTLEDVFIEAVLP